MATKKRGPLLPDSGIDWSQPLGESQPIVTMRGTAEPAPQAPQARSLPAAINDTVIDFANMAVGGVSSAADYIAPGNSMSKYIDKNIIEAGRASQSDVVRAEDARYAQEMQDAQGASDEVLASLGFFARNPIRSAAMAAGSFVVPGAAIKGAKGVASMLGLGEKAVGRAGLAGGAAAGGALAGGDAAGTAYDLALKAGATEEQAIDAARQASVIPSMIGAAGGVVGAERLFAGAGGFKGATLSRAFKTGGVEAGQEAIEEGVTTYEGQRAAMPYDPTIDPMKGVAGAATMGAVLGGITGGGIAALTAHPADAVRETKLPESGPLTKAINAGVENEAQQVESAVADVTTQTRRQQTAPIVAQIRALPPEQQQEALQMLAVADNQNAPGAVRRRAQNRLDFLFASVAPLAAPIADPAAEDFVSTDTGEVTSLGLAPRTEAPSNGVDFEADPRFAGAPTYPNGQAPASQVFGTEQAATIAIGEMGLMGSHEVAPAAGGGFQIRPIGADARLIAPGLYETTQPPAPPTPPAAPAGEGPAAPPPPNPPAPPPSAPPADPAPAEAPASAFEQREADRPAEDFPPAQPGDITNPSGLPFLSMPAAMRALAKAGDGFELVRVKDGLVVRKKEATNVNQPDVEGATGLAPAPADGRGDNPDGSVGGVGLLPADTGGGGQGTAAAPTPGGKADGVVGGTSAPDSAVAPTKEKGSGFRVGDTVQTPEGEGTVTGNSGGKVRVQIAGKNRTFPRAEVSKTTSKADATANDQNTQDGTRGKAKAATGQASAAEGGDAAAAAGVPATGGAAATETGGLTNEPPLSFRQSQMVETEVYKGGKPVKQEVDAETALQALNTDIDRLKKFLACVKGA